MNRVKFNREALAAARYLSKQAFVPMPAGEDPGMAPGGMPPEMMDPGMVGPDGMPMDPAMMGGMPPEMMDPGMVGPDGMPMDPSMLPPEMMYPNMMGGAPMDPNMLPPEMMDMGGGGMITMTGAEFTELLITIIQAVVGAGGATKQAKGGGKGNSVEAKVDALAQALGVDVGGGGMQ